MYFLYVYVCINVCVICIDSNFVWLIILCYLVILIYGILIYVFKNKKKCILIILIIVIM